MGSGRPRRAAIAIHLLTGDDKAAYLAEVPANDARFIPTFTHLRSIRAYAPEEAYEWRAVAARRPSL
jgi:hypothetical protein